MIITILIITGIYFLLGHGAYLQSVKKCKTEQDKSDLKAFRVKLYTKWMYYAIWIGKVRQHIKNVKHEDRNLVEQTYPGDPDMITTELFSNCFGIKERKGASIFAQYIVNPTLT